MLENLNIIIYFNKLSLKIYLKIKNLNTVLFDFNRLAVFPECHKANAFVCLNGAVNSEKKAKNDHRRNIKCSEKQAFPFYVYHSFYSLSNSANAFPTSSAE